MTVVTLLVFVNLIALAYYLVGLIPDAMLQKVLRIVIVVGAVLWILTHLQGLLHLRVQ